MVNKEEEVERVGVGRVRGGEDTFRPEMDWTEAILLRLGSVCPSILGFQPT